MGATLAKLQHFYLHNLIDESAFIPTLLTSIPYALALSSPLPTISEWKKHVPKTLIFHQMILFPLIRCGPSFALSHILYQLSISEACS